MLTCPDCGTRLIYKHLCRVPDHAVGRECERVKLCPNCRQQYMTREVVTRKLPN